LLQLSPCILIIWMAIPDFCVSIYGN
jgi:hypothetical protein